MTKPDDSGQGARDLRPVGYGLRPKEDGTWSWWHGEVPVMSGNGPPS